jgi:hypothetical protein
MIAHFFDIETLIRVDSGVWVISEDNPNHPLVKISQSEFNLIKKGLYKNHDRPLKMGREKYWLPDNLYSILVSECKRTKSDISKLFFSMQEFMNPEVIEQLNFKIYKNHFRHLKNKTDHIYIILSRNTKNNYKPIIEKLEKELKEMGLVVSGYYYLSKTFYSRDEDRIAYEKAKLVLQHLIGMKTEDGGFTRSEISRYDKILFYDDDDFVIKTLTGLNDIFNAILKNTKDPFIGKRIVQDILNKNSIELEINRVNFNTSNLFTKETIVLGEDSSNIIMFESFKFLF